MKRLNYLLRKAEHSTLYLLLVNLVLKRLVPFNAPHKIRLTKVNGNRLTFELPFKKPNLNHIGGIHACALATLCEYASGLTLLHVLGAQQYRIIMKSISVNYLYQAKTAVRASMQLDVAEVASRVLEPMKSQESVMLAHTVDVFDATQKLICTGSMTWQIKPWTKVKTSS